MGLTATATASTVSSIASELMLDNNPNSIITDIPLPDNLMLSVSRDKDRDKALINLLNGNRFKNCSSIIVYCIRREECERIASFIRTAFQVIKLNKICFWQYKSKLSFIYLFILISHNIQMVNVVNCHELLSHIMLD